MNTENIDKNLAAPSVTIAPRRGADGLYSFVVTLATYKDVRAYPCRSMESALKLAERFLAGVTRSRVDAPAPQPTAVPGQLVLAA
jgi:hypothetical protein